MNEYENWKACLVDVKKKHKSKPFDWKISIPRFLERIIFGQEPDPMIHESRDGILEQHF